METSAIKIQIHEAKNGQYYFTPIGGNNEILAMSEFYTTEPDARRAAEALFPDVPIGGKIAIQKTSVRHDDALVKVRQILGIPQDEPIFVLRAQDAAARETIAEYEYLTSHGEYNAGTEFSDGITARLQEFQQWADQNPDKMKTPDA